MRMEVFLVLSGAVLVGAALSVLVLVCVRARRPPERSVQTTTRRFLDVPEFGTPGPHDAL